VLFTSKFLIITISILYSSFSFSGIHKPNLFINNDFLSEAFKYCGLDIGSNHVIVKINLTDDQLSCVKGFELGNLKSNEDNINTLSKSELITSPDDRLFLEKPSGFSPRANSEVYFLAKEDFGLVEYLKLNPSHDGRGVIAGVIDDGVSPMQSGFKTTSSGERKYIKHFSNSSFYKVLVQPNVEEEESNEMLGVLNEKDIDLDFNGDNEKSSISFKVIRSRDPSDKDLICADLNENSEFEASECVKSFNETGEYLIKNNGLDSLLLEFNRETSYVHFNEGEGRGDSHGEGVASVLLGHNIGGRFDGVAPGAKLIDYDLSERGSTPDESAYTIGKFLNAIELLAKNGASVINISYSLYFSSIESQLMMRNAIEAISDNYDCLVVFSAGNNGPGLGSLNRSAIYPHNSFSTGAFVGKKLDAYVHGVSGLPEEGRVIYYSSRGPGALGGSGPSLIAPLASLTHADIRNGFRGFSGTSSASPALAGFATVFKSAILQSGREFNFDSFTYAIKYSGKRLKHSPYIEQGYGIPKIEDALKIYDLLIAGEFPRVTTTAVDKLLRWGLPSEGLVLNRSEIGRLNQFFTYLTHQFPDSIPSQERLNKVLPVNIEASGFIETVSKSWLDHGTNRFGFSINKEKIEWNDNTEVFGEITVRDEQTNTIVAVVPITLIDDTLFSHSRHFSISIGPEEGKRIHVNVPNDVKAIKVTANLLSEDDDRVIVSLYNPYGIRVQRKWLKSFSLNSFYFPVERSGKYQIGLSRSKGTKDPTKFDLTLSPVSIKLRTNYGEVSDKKIKVLVENKSDYLEGKILLNFIPKSDFKKVVRYKKNDGYSFDWPVNRSGDYELFIESSSEKFSYVSMRCFHNKNTVENFTGYELSGLEVGSNITTRCIPFDYFSDREGQEQLFFNWRKKISKKLESASKRLDSGTISSYVVPFNLESLEGFTDSVEVSFLPGDAKATGPIRIGKFLLITD